MSVQGGLTADKLIASLRRRRAALPSEIGTFLVFEASERLLESDPRLVDATCVALDSQGAVRLTASAPPASEADSARSLHALLTSILLSARPGLSPALLRVVEEGPSTGEWTRESLRDDLEAALVPLNRLASRRVLARLLREASADRMRGDPTEADLPTFNELDEALVNLLSDPPPALTAPTGSARGDEPTIREQVVQVDDGDAALDEQDMFQDVPTARLEVSSQLRPAAPPRRDPTPANRGQARPAARAVQATDPLAAQLHEFEGSARGSSRGLWLGVGFVALAVLLAAVVGLLRPDALARLTGSAPPAPPPIELPETPAPRRAGGLTLNLAPARSQVLMSVGTAPLEVKDVSVGVAQEFVAMAEGRSPSRALIDADESWEDTDQGPFYELAMQTGRSDSSDPAEVGETLLPPSRGGSPRRRDGRVRVITTPRGAQVYRVVGFAPSMRIEGLDPTQALDLLVVRDGYAPQRLEIGPETWPAAPQPAELSLEVELSKRTAKRRRR